MEVSDKSSMMTILIMGATGAGKSYLGNQIVKKQVFKESADKSSETLNPTASTCTLGSEKLSVTVIDCPGFGDNRRGESEYSTLKRILSVFKRIKGTLTLVLYCVKATDDRLNIEGLKKLAMYFGDGIYNNTLLVYTQADRPATSLIDKENFLATFRADTRTLLLEHPTLKSMVDKDVLVWYKHRSEELFYDPLIKYLKLTPNYKHPLLKINIEDPKGYTEYLSIPEFQEFMELAKSHVKQQIRETERELRSETDSVKKRKIKKALDCLKDADNDLNKLLFEHGGVQLAILLAQNDLDDQLYDYFYTREKEVSLYNDIKQIIEQWYGETSSQIQLKTTFWNDAIKEVNQKLPAVLKKRCQVMIKFGTTAFEEAYASSLAVKSYSFFEPLVKGFVNLFEATYALWETNFLGKIGAVLGSALLLLPFLGVLFVNINDFEWSYDEELQKVVDSLHMKLQDRKKLYKALAKNIDNALKPKLKECWSFVENN